MSDIANSEGASESEKPVQDDVQFPPFPDPKDEDFDEDIPEEERNYYKTVFKDLNSIKGMRLHCSACDRHMGCSARNEVRMRAHPMLRTLVCHNCHVFYNSGEFEKGDDGSELYCRWCGQGGQVYCCSDCPHVFCAKCIKRNLGNPKIKEIENADDWRCFKCNSKCLWDLRALCWAVLRYCDLKNNKSTEASTAGVQTITLRKMKKTNAQKCREYREKQKLQNTVIQNISTERSDECNKTDQLQAKKKPKTNAERRKKHYEAQKLKKQGSKKIPKTVKQRNKEYYYRKKKKQALNTINHDSDVMAYQAQDPELKEAYKKDCSIDYSECCKHKSNRRTKSEKKVKEIKKEVESKSTSDTKSSSDAKAAANNIISKIPSTIQVKKFASVNIDDLTKPDKKAQKRSSSPKNKAIFVKNPITIAPASKVLNPISLPPLAKKMRLPNSPMINAIRLPNERKQNMSTYSRIRPKPPHLPIAIANCFNGFGNNAAFYNSVADNINLSIENLTQGLDMAAVASISQNIQDDDVVCTPDFPLEPVCEVTEDNDDDVECITPGPVAPPRITNPPPLVPRSTNTSTAEISSDNIVQMTDNDVTVNASTGGLKFRVDPQTLSSNKMYRLPDGRIFAINANPNMPGGYSATIVAVTEPTGKAAPKGAIYAAKLSAVPPVLPAATPKTSRNMPRILKRSTPKSVKISKSSEATSSRDCDLNVPVEWYRYNLIDAVDALEYALSRLHKLKKEATTVYLRTRTVNEMRNLHRTLERLLSTSSSRFGEIRENLNKGLKQYVLRKSGGENSEDDDDVEILPDMEDNDDPIFIDENSVESTMNGSENQEVDLTGAGSSEYNDSGENTKDNNCSSIDIDPLNATIEHGDVLAVLSHNDTVVASEISQETGDNTSKSDTDHVKGNETESRDDEKNSESKDIEKESERKQKEKKSDINIIENETDNFGQENKTENNDEEKELDNDIEEHEPDKNKSKKETEKQEKVKENITMEVDADPNDTNINTHATDSVDNAVKSCDDVTNKEIADEVNGVIAETVKSPVELTKVGEAEEGMEHKDLSDKADSQDSDDKMQDAEMSEEMIETLLKDDNAGDESSSSFKEVLQET